MEIQEFQKERDRHRDRDRQTGVGVREKKQTEKWKSDFTSRLTVSFCSSAGRISLTRGIWMMK